ncbi:shikimate 5-dehydrogenase [Marmoricola endophyticus]|uniref:Shikimate 5-dehydrogenase n=1 Tax=Marmoricola endophyticus TaxID=2040280 RepID=A0A917F1N5_9ACTN|nr:shikimate dehydrogenase [Marmoricola endophyticus]GGF35979.1 shikimate 5-dehydrogenase [Marmoricola endophyticus]
MSSAGEAVAVRCAVWGSPVAHSLSPVLHAAAYDALGLAGWEYGRADVDEAGLPAALAALDGSWRGLSLTMPLKRAVIGLLDSVSPVAEAAGAVNTVLLCDGRRTGDNTDVPGITAAVRERVGDVRSAVVVGGGATAASSLLGLADVGCERVTLVVRDPARAERTVAVAAEHGGVEVAVASLADVSGLRETSADLLVGTVPGAAWTPDLLAATAHVPAVFEMVYDGWPTPLAAAAGTDRVLVSPLDLLVHQAVRQVQLMTGLPLEVVEPALAPMRDAGEVALRERPAG